MYGKLLIWKKRIRDILQENIQVLKEFRKKNVRQYNDYNLGNGVELYYWGKNNDIQNLGDYLSQVVCEYLLSQNNISPCENEDYINKVHLYCMGSILGFRCQNAVVWGTGILDESSLYKKRIKLSEYDIRAVRGPKTRSVLLAMGMECPEVYGDPGILMPEIYLPGALLKQYNISYIPHLSEVNETIEKNKLHINIISMETTDYQTVIDEIVKSKKVISSSLHGLILAEAYGVPAVLLLENGKSTFKYEDWYLSTGRTQYNIAHSLEEAMEIDNVSIPNLEELRNGLKAVFPYDLWRV